MPGGDDQLALDDTTAQAPVAADPALANTTASQNDGDAPAADRHTLDPSSAEPRPADRLPAVDRDRYQVSGELARGGLGRILRARDRHLGRTVALKEMLRGGADAERRFVREALITARLEHPAIVPVHEAGRGDDGAPFYAMKLVGGRPLTDVISDARTTAARLALVPRILAVADAVAYAHSRRVIHRDLKPGNVLCGEFGETVVIDWGIAKDLDAGESDGELAEQSDERAALSASQTVDGAILGTPAYMAPEQAAGEPVDERADVYALGAMLYEVLSGATPHRGATLDEVLRKVIAGDLVPLQRRAPEIPADLAAIVGKAMARAPADRYGNAGELADDLRRYVTGQLVAVYRYGRFERLRRWVSKNRAAVAVGAIATAILAVVGVIAIRDILRERDTARAASAVAVARAAEARNAERAAQDRADELLIAEARAAVNDDPTRAIAILAGLAPESTHWSAARVVAADARDHGIGDVLIGHDAATEAIALDGDGARVATLGKDGIRIWDRGARTVRALPLPDPCGGSGDCTFGAWRLALSRDGRWLVASGGACTRWDLATPAAPPVTFAGSLVSIEDDGRLITRSNEGEIDRGGIAVAGAATTAAIGAGDAVAGLDDHGVREWRAGIPGPAWTGATDLDHLAISPDGDTIAWMATAPTPRLWLRGRGGIARSWPVDSARSLAVAPGGTTLAFVDKRGLAWLTTVPVADLRHTTMPPIGDLSTLTATADPGTFVAAGDHGVALVHADGTSEILIGERREWRAAVSGDGTTLVAGGTATPLVWRLPPPRRSIASPPHAPTPPGVVEGGGSADGADLATAAGQPSLVVDWMGAAVERWHVDGDALVRDGDVPVPPLSDLRMSSTGDLLFVDDAGAALLTGTTVHRLDRATLGWFGPDGAAYTSDDEDHLRRWNRDGSGGDAVCPDTARWRQVKVSDDGSTVGDVDGTRVLRCRLATGAVDALDAGAALAPWAWRDDGEAAAGYDAAAHALVVVDASGRTTFPLDRAPASVHLSPDGRWLVAIAAEGGFAIVAVEDGTMRPVSLATTFDGNLGWLPGDVAAIVSDRGTVVVDLRSGTSRILDAPMVPSAIATDADGAILVAAGDQVRLWRDDLPRDPQALRNWIASATDARVGADGELAWAQPYRVLSP